MLADAGDEDEDNSKSTSPQLRTEPPALCNRSSGGEKLSVNGDAP